MSLLKEAQFFCLHRLAVRTMPSQGVNTGSIPVGDKVNG